MVIMMNTKKDNYTLGVLYGVGPEIEMLTQKFVGNLINADDFCRACEDKTQDIKCDKCREHLKCYSSSIYLYEQVGKGVPDFIEEPEGFLPKNVPPMDFLLVVGIHQDLLGGLPEYLKDKDVRAVVVPIEDPHWVPPGLQTQVLADFEKVGIQAVFPKPFCALSMEYDENNKVGYHLTEKHDLIHEFIRYFKIGVPIVSFLLNKDGKSIEDRCVIQAAPCGSTYYICQKLKGNYIENGELSLNEKISKAHHAYPCNASMDQDTILKDSCLHVGGYLVRNAIRRDLDLEEQEGEKLNYIIK